MLTVKRAYGIALSDVTFVELELADPASAQWVQPALADGAVATTATLTTTGRAVNNETFTVGTRVYTWKTVLTGAANEVKVGAATAADDMDAAVAAIMRAAGEGTTYGLGTARHPDVSAVRSGNNMVLTGPKSADGNAIATTETMTNASFAAGTMASGADSDIMIRRERNREESGFSEFTFPTNSRFAVWKPTATQMKCAKLALAAEDLTATKVWIDNGIVIETTGHHLAMHTEGVIYAGFLTAVAAGSMTLASPSGFDPGFPANTTLRGCFVQVRQSDVSSDLGCTAWVSETGFDGSTNGVVTLGLNWNRTPTGTPANIEVAFYGDLRWVTLNGTPQTGDVFARAGAPAGASLAADIAAIKSDTAGVATILARIPAALVGGRIDASVGAMAAGVLTAAAIAANAFALASFAADTLTRWLPASIVTRFTNREGQGGVMTVGAGAHTTTAIVASDVANGTRLKGRLGIIYGGTTLARVIRFTGDVGAAGAVAVADTAAAALPAALTNGDVIQY